MISTKNEQKQKTMSVNDIRRKVEIIAYVNVLLDCEAEKENNEACDRSKF